MLQNYSGIFFMFVFAAALAGIFITLSQVLGPKKPNPVKDKPFECGKNQFASPQGRHAVKFYLAGMLFVLFDVELIFFFPWAVIYRELGLFGFIEMMIFIAMLGLGFAYAWRKGALTFR